MALGFRRLAGQAREKKKSLKHAHCACHELLAGSSRGPELATSLLGPRPDQGHARIGTRPSAKLRGGVARTADQETPVVGDGSKPTEQGMRGKLCEESTEERKRVGYDMLTSIEI